MKTVFEIVVNDSASDITVRDKVCGEAAYILDTAQSKLEMDTALSRYAMVASEGCSPLTN